MVFAADGTPSPQTKSPFQSLVGVYGFCGVLQQSGSAGGAAVSIPSRGLWFLRLSFNS